MDRPHDGDPFPAGTDPPAVRAVDAAGSPRVRRKDRQISAVGRINIEGIEAAIAPHGWAITAAVIPPPGAYAPSVFAVW